MNLNQTRPSPSGCPADPDGCAPNTCTRNDCPKCGATSNPKDRECYRCGAGLAGAPILRPDDILGDRRGVAVERGLLREYHPGTLDVRATRAIWIVYVDGVAVRTQFQEDWAEADARLVRRVRARMAS